MLKRIPNPEIVIGLVAPVGVDLAATKAALSDEFRAKGYRAFFVKVTDVFPQLHKRLHGRNALKRKSYIDRITSYIEFGNELRERFDRYDILAASAIFQIMRVRRKYFKKIMHSGAEDEGYEQSVFIIDQLKRPEEIALLRNVYGEQFFQLSVYARRETRIKYVAGRVTKELAVVPGKTAESMAVELVATDENEASKKFGQRVGKTFHGADFIIHTEVAAETVETQAHRFAELLFGSNRISPSKAEYGMYAAKGAALRTLDLSRQVGAAIFTERGEIIALGSNEVPKAGGGTYWSDDGGLDAREYTLGADSNDELKYTVSREFFENVASFLDVPASFEEFASKPEMSESRAMDALEYGRIVHAEMSALMDAARRGSAVGGAILFTTTFPCHMCAKHIVASGVSRVVYLEPYPKSLVPELHLDSISIDGSDRGRYSKYGAVAFEHFYGVTPRRYRELFERGKRKDDAGKFVAYDHSPPEPILRVFRPSYVKLEDNVIRSGLGKLVSMMFQLPHRRQAPPNAPRPSP